MSRPVPLEMVLEESAGAEDCEAGAEETALGDGEAATTELVVVAAEDAGACKKSPAAVVAGGEVTAACTAATGLDATGAGAAG